MSNWAPGEGCNRDDKSAYPQQSHQYKTVNTLKVSCLRREGIFLLVLSVGETSSRVARESDGSVKKPWSQLQQTTNRLPFSSGTTEAGEIDPSALGSLIDSAAQAQIV